ncbi:MAG: helix-turn-helix domain-containing protein [Sphingobacteriales bacterium]|nr:helix-turn-helix domain-containing protein [Sphingobacteriales bacterium]
MTMTRLPTDFQLSIKEYLADSSPLHRHNYFELIYVLEGRGIHVINENQFAYGRDDLFLLTPTDSHTFQTHVQSTFCIIDFTASFFERVSPVGEDKPELGYFFKELEYIFQNAAKYQGHIEMNEEDRTFSGMLVRRLIREWGQQVFFREIVLQNLVFLLLNIIARYAAETGLVSSKEKTANMAYEMIYYIQHHIYDNDCITLDQLAKQFHLSKDYVGAYFRTHTGKTIKQFVLDYKLELAKTRLLHSRLTISEIAAELGFTDESHLNKAFRKQTGMTAKQYRSKRPSTNT